VPGNIGARTKLIRKQSHRKEITVQQQLEIIVRQRKTLFKKIQTVAHFINIHPEEASEYHPVVCEASIV